MVILCIPLSYVSFAPSESHALNGSNVSVNAGHQLGPSTVSEYLAANENIVIYQDPALVKAFKELGIRYLRVNGPFDSVIPVNKLRGGKLALDFKGYEQHLESLRTILRAKPLIILGYMAKAISSQPGKSNYWTYPTANWDDWYHVVSQLVRHNVRNNFAGLYYEVWNEPETGCPSCDWQGSYQDYIRLYIAAAKAVKAADPSAKVGGPAASHWTNPWMGHSNQVHTGPFIKDFLSSIKHYNESNPDSAAPLDFISWHHYWTDYLSDGTKAVDRYIAEVGFPGNPRYLVTEWNSEWGQAAHPWPRKASFVAANIIQQIRAPKVWPFWFTFGLQHDRELSTDYNSGLIAHDNIHCKRPTYAAFQMMNAMTTGNFVGTSSPHELAIMATRDDQAFKVTAVVANYNPTNKSAKVSFTGLPFTTSSIKQKIQWIDKTRSMGCGGLEAGTVDHLSVKNKSISFGLNFPAYSIAQITLTSKR